MDPEVESADDPENNEGVEENVEESEEKEILWRPLTSVQRRVAGVLIEKSKTTPDNYPLSLNAIKTGSNQKSNRSPQMDLQEHEVEEVLYELRGMGAAMEVHSGGRVPKYKHQLYEWFDVDKVELSVLAELMLRGEQTMGDLRARASRMDRIEGLNGLRPIFQSLLEKGLVVELTPPGRGQMVTHNVYSAGELERIQTQYEGGAKPATAPSRQAASPTPPGPTASELESLREEVVSLRKKVESLEQEVSEIKSLLHD